MQVAHLPLPLPLAPLRPAARTPPPPPRVISTRTRARRCPGATSTPPTSMRPALIPRARPHWLIAAGEPWPPRSLPPPRPRELPHRPQRAAAPAPCVAATRCRWAYLDTDAVDGRRAAARPRQKVWAAWRCEFEQTRAFELRKFRRSPHGVYVASIFTGGWRRELPVDAFYRRFSMPTACRKRFLVVVGIDHRLYK